MAKALRFIIPLIIAIFILLILFSRLDSRAILLTFGGSDKILLIFLPLILLIAHVITAMRWQALLKIVGCKIDSKNALRLFFANLPIAKIVPLYGGEFLRTYYLRDKISIVKHSGLIFSGMIFDIFTLGVFSVVGGIILGAQVAYVFGALVLIGIIGIFPFITCVGACMPRSLKSKVSNFMHIFHVLRKQPLALIEVLILTLAIWVLVMLFIKFTFLAFSSDVSFIAILSFQPIVTLVSLLPITIWGVGTRESLMIFLFSGMAQEPVIFAVGLTYSFIGAIFMPALFLPLTLATLKDLNLSFFKK